MSGTRVDTTRISQSGTSTRAAKVRSFDDDKLKQIGEDYAGYIGPPASRLVRHHAANSASLEQLVESLAREIPDFRDREKFRNQWLRS